MFKWMAALIILPLALAIFGGDRFRYPCQDPENWDKDICKAPACEVRRECPEQIFKGTDDEKITTSINPPPAPTVDKDKGACLGKQ